MGNSNYKVEFRLYYDDMSATMPVPPETFKMVKSSGVDVYENVAGETKSKAVSSGLYRCTINALLPEVDESSTSGMFLPDNVIHMYRGVGDLAPVAYPHDYVRILFTAQRDLKPIYVVPVGMVGVNPMWMNVDRFDYGFKAGTMDVEMSIDLIQSIPMTVSTIVKKPTAVSPPVTSTGTNNKFAIGDKVMLTGRYFYDSYGSSPSYIFKNGFVGQVHKIMPESRAYPIHITLPNSTAKNNWVGWVKRNQIIKVI